VDVGVAYLSWTDTDMVRGADQDTVLAEMRSRLPWPANRTGRLEPAVERLTRGILHRSAHVYGQAWVRGMQWLPRGVLPAAIAARGAQEVKRLSARLPAGAEQRRRPVGPGGLSALRDRADRSSSSED
jgi:hypothetical protein